MKIILISNDVFLRIAVKYFFPDVEFINGGSALKYLTSKSDKRMCVLIDNRIPDIKFYSIRSYCRYSDYLVLLKIGVLITERCFSMSFNKILDLNKSLSEILDALKAITRKAKKKKDFKIRYSGDILNKKELRILELLIKEASICEMSSLTGLSIQSIYRYRERIVTKYGYDKYAFFSSELASTQRILNGDI